VAAFLDLLLSAHIGTAAGCSLRSAPTSVREQAILARLLAATSASGETVWRSRPCSRHPRRVGQGALDGLHRGAGPAATPASLGEWLPQMHISTALLTGFQHAAAPPRNCCRIWANGQLKLLVGTHGPLLEDRVPVSPGLAWWWSIEQHRFGVRPAHTACFGKGLQPHSCSR